MTTEHQVLMDSAATDQEIAAVRKAFRLAGVAADVRAEIERKAFDLDALPWIVQILTPGIAAFGFEIGKEGGKAAVDGLRRLTSDIYSVRKTRREGGVVWEVAATRTSFLLEPGLPDEAYHEIPVTSAPDQVLRWDARTNRWVSEQ